MFVTSTGHLDIFSNFSLLFHFSGQTKVKNYNDPLPSTSSSTGEFLLHENIVTIVGFIRNCQPTRVEYLFIRALPLVVGPFFQNRLVFSFTGHFDIFSNFSLLFHFSGQTKVKDYNDPLPSTSSSTGEFLLHENIVTIVGFIRNC